MTAARPRIIYLTHWRFPSEKTMTPLILKTCEGFVREGYEVELWIPNRRNIDSGNSDLFERYGIRERFEIRRLPTLDAMHVLGSVGFLFMVASFNVSAFLALRGRNDVIVYAHDLRDVIVPSLRRLPLYVEIHDFYESSLRFLNAFVLKRCTGLIVTNTLKMERLSKRYGFPHERMIHQPNAVDYAFFAAAPIKEETRRILGLPQDRRLVIYTGHLFSWKGVDTLAEAVAYLPEDTDVYFVGGTEHDRVRLKTFVQERKLPRIVFVEHQPHDRMPLWQGAADVLILPNTAKEEASRLETSPVKLFEYLSSGHPAVVSDLPSIRDVVSDREVFFFEPDDAIALARTICAVLASPEEAKVRSEAAQALARRHSWESRSGAIAAFIGERTS